MPTAARRRARSRSRRYSRDGADQARRRASSALIDNQINQTTATIRLKAIFPNPRIDALAEPVREGAPPPVDAQGRARRPGAAVQRGPQGDVRLRRRRRTTPSRCGPSTLDSIQGDDAIIAKGLAGRRAGRHRRPEPAPPGREDRSRARRRREAAPPAARRRAATRRPRRAASSARRRRAEPRREHLRAVHPAAGRDDAAMVGLLLAGIVGLPAARRSRRCRRSTTRPSSSRRTCRARSAETMASAVTTPLERQFGQMPSLTQMTSVSSFGELADHAAVHARPQHRRRRAGRAGGDQRRLEPAARRTLPDAADLQQEQPRRHADPHARVSSRHAAARPGRRLRRLDPRAEDLAGLGRRPRHAQRRPEAGGARAGRPGGARRLGLRPRGRARRDRRARTSTSPRATSTARARTTRSRRTTSSTRPTAFKPLVIAYKNGSPIRLRDVANVDRRRRERAARRLGRTTSAPSS